MDLETQQQMFNTFSLFYFCGSGLIRTTKYLNYDNAKKQKMLTKLVALHNCSFLQLYYDIIHNNNGKVLCRNLKIYNAIKLWS